ncbi:similar to Saccharomyces cerevisiae YOL033W MSE1 Mitochondrial glutamyl-tRNA synthetase, predicted to be palmitoylated [Maudiozyma saulgeensis]|uniref:Glutamate--tRNA ligase, mitochondrial n=1 Tax=Maudiozyma saulgeensis TaxID=1789683 RepID=A0A1X7R3J7_9SACH|nr:similar to Saccharomyces cerevisiae YOL033W MSE1 Mitochondrial glutamyl-tRNA synthetase, predicted to be palmitoylated [Kazachstania saulgeensis]
MNRLLLGRNYKIVSIPRISSKHYVTNWTRDYSSLLSHKQSKKVSVQPNYPVVTRFAPSPTGSLHIGSLRTALYNFLLARNTKGKFILRLEDTDRTRLKPEAEQNIYDTMKWCGFNIDEGPIKQSERKEIYAEHIKKLLDKGLAYRCFCSKEKLEASRLDGYDRHCLHLTEEQISTEMKENNGKFIVRFKAPEKYESFADLLHGEVNIQDRKDRIGYDDLVLVKSDGMPTYHFANVVDDHLMGVTHVIRGDEWLPSTPKHIMLYKAFGWTAPKFIHIPLLTSVESDKKLSKRRNDASVLALKEKGILPEALINFCALLGWSPPRDVAQRNHECFTLEELTQLFNLDHLTKGNVKVDNSKLLFFNKHFLQKRIDNEEQLNELVLNVVPKVSALFGIPIEVQLKEKVKLILKDCGHCLNTINDFQEEFSYFFKLPDYTGQSEETQKFIKGSNKDKIISILEASRTKLQSSTIQETISEITKTLGVSKKLLFQSLRFALSGNVSGAKIHVILDILGDAESRNRLEVAIRYLKTM